MDFDLVEQYKKKLFHYNQLIISIELLSTVGKNFHLYVRLVRIQDY